MACLETIFCVEHEILRVKCLEGFSYQLCELSYAICLCRLE